MDLNEIYEKYPKACAAMFSFGDPISEDFLKVVLKSEWLLSIGERELFDFFDIKEIFIEIRKVQGRDEWTFYITYDKIDIYITYKLYKSRKDAEKDAFEKAFELLEKQLLIDLLNKD